MPIDDYLRPTPHAFPVSDLALDPDIIDTLWRLFCAIGHHWQNVADSAPMKSRWLVFLDNRIRTDPSYAHDYRAGARLMQKMIAEEGESQAFQILFTRPEATISPPATPLARLRQRVSNEFITLQLSLGGFQGFVGGGDGANFPGYFGGSNIPGKAAPYRCAGDEP